MNRNRGRHRKGNRGGFTLIEILLVVAIIGILLGVALPRLTGRRRMAELAAAKADVENIGTALRLYELDMGEYPASLQGLVSAPGGSENWNGPYLEKGLPKDPWGNDYIYACPGSQNPHGYDLSSPGPASGKGAGEPIGNW